MKTARMVRGRPSLSFRLGSSMPYLQCHPQSVKCRATKAAPAAAAAPVAKISIVARLHSTGHAATSKLRSRVDLALVPCSVIGQQGPQIPHCVRSFRNINRDQDSGLKNRQDGARVACRVAGDSLDSNLTRGVSNDGEVDRHLHTAVAQGLREALRLRS